MKHLKTTVQTPSFYNLLPLLIIRGIFNFVCAIPKAISAYQKAKADEEARLKAEEEAEEKLRKELEEDKKQREERKKEKQVSSTTIEVIFTNVFRQKKPSGRNERWNVELNN